MNIKSSKLIDLIADEDNSLKDFLIALDEHASLGDENECALLYVLRNLLIHLREANDDDVDSTYSDLLDLP